MRRIILIAAAILTLQTATEAGQKSKFVRVNLPLGLGRATVFRALEGAKRRLQDPACLQVLTDFQDAGGRTLQANLEALAKPAADYLADLWFVDGGESWLCLTMGAAAFTAPRGRVIFVCTSRFADPSSALRSTLGEIVIIHEMLHTLGLRENPPTSAYITAQVMKRCDR